MPILVGGRRLRVDPAASIGKGGEADVYDIGGGRALKLFKPPDHPDLEGDPAAQQGARDRLDEHQHKLPAFPTGLPERVVVPEELARDARGRVCGYTMRRLKGAEVLLRFGERGFRHAIDNAAVLALFRDLHATVRALHAAGVVIGDFNDLNVLAPDGAAYLIDADSMQFGGYPCRVFTERFVDPLLCDPAARALVLARPHTPASDWYAFAAMLMRALLFVEPYGGVYRPADPAARLTPPERPLRRITVFHPEVRYPKPAERWDVLPDDLLHHFHAVFVKDQRDVFPLALLEARWTRCAGCGHEHARALCPHCAGAPRAAVRDVTRVRGEVTARRVFATAGTILEAAFQGGRLRFLYQDGDVVRREDGTAVLAGRAAGVRFRLMGARTLAGKGSAVVTLGVAGAVERFPADVVDGATLFDANETRACRVHDGRLMRDGALDPERIGDVLAGQTSIWIGPTFGFGFYRAGALQVSFVFDVERGGLNDGVAVPRIAGQLTEVRCVFGAERAYVLTASQENGRTLHRAAAIGRDGRLLGTAVAAAGDGSWLGHLSSGCAAGDALLVPTDDGLVRVEVDAGTLVKTREFPDTDAFLDAGSRLVAGTDGLYVVDRGEIRCLTLRAL
jgi:hypothetical protein